MCEKSQLTFNYNKFDWILKKNSDSNHEEYKDSNNKNKDKDKDKEKEKDKDRDKDKDGNIKDNK